MGQCCFKALDEKTQHLNPSPSCLDHTLVLPKENTPLEKLKNNLKIVTLEERRENNEYDQLYVLLASGKYAPPHRVHIDMMEHAKLHLECQTDVRGKVLSGYLSPHHDLYLEDKFDMMPAIHRVSMCKLITKKSDWLDVDSWECSQKESVNIMAVCKRLQNYLRYHLGNDALRIKVCFVCGSDFLLQENISIFENQPINVIVVRRATYTDGVNSFVQKQRKRGVDITYIEEFETENYSSSLVRDCLFDNFISDSDKIDNIQRYCPVVICDYLIKHKNQFVPLKY